MSSRRILVVGPNWIGDLVMANVLLKLLKRAEPDVAIDLLVPAPLAGLAARMGEVAETFEAPGGHGRLALGARLHLARSLRGRGYVQAYVLPRSAKAALVPWLARIPRRTGYRGESRYGLINDMRTPDPLQRSVGERYAALAFAPGAELPRPLPQPVLASDIAARQRMLERLVLGDARGAIVLAPGAEYGPAKRWPAASFAELAGRFAVEGHSVWILGSARERALGDAIVESTPRARNLAGKTNLVEAVDLLAAAAAAVTNDSGLMHVAAAVGTPLVAIYGSSSPDYTPPLSENARVLYHALPCSPCFARECPLGHLNCLRGIGPSEVHGALVAVMRAASTAGRPLNAGDGPAA